MDYFDKYTSNYDMNVEEINYKYYHSYRVMDNIVTIAKNLNLNKKDIELAKCIGILHDIGRFEQLKEYKSYEDDNMDHADYGVYIIKKEQMLKHFNIDASDYDIVYKAIKNHNKYKIEECNDENIIRHAKLIRDTDKIDILLVMGALKETGSVIDDSKVSRKVIEEIKKHRTVSKKDMKTKNDSFVNKLAFAYDINYDCCLKELQHNMEYFYKQLKDNKDLLDMYNEVINLTSGLEC